MNLTEVERLTLVNQYKILKISEPSLAETYDHYIRILEKGIQSQYRCLANNIWPNIDEETSTEVHDILTMFDLLDTAIKTHGLDTTPGKGYPQFAGFSVNYESDHHTVSEFLFDTNQYVSVFEQLTHGLNSHSPSLRIYREMLEAYHNIDFENLPNLTLEETKTILLFPN